MDASTVDFFPKRATPGASLRVEVESPPYNITTNEIHRSIDNCKRLSVPSIWKIFEALFITSNLLFLFSHRIEHYSALWAKPSRLLPDSNYERFFNFHFWEKSRGTDEKGIDYGKQEWRRKEGKIFRLMRKRGSEDEEGEKETKVSLWGGRSHARFHKIMIRAQTI